MLNKILDLIRENRRNQKEIIRYSRELYWSNLFLETNKDNTWLKTFPLNLGGWAAGYPFMYILSRVIKEYKPNHILELGLGESSKFISEFIKNSSYDIKHIILEHDVEWLNQFEKNYKLSKNSKVQLCKIESESYREYQVKSYKEIENLKKTKFDFYIIDGPVGTNRYSRFDMIKLGESLSKNDEFIFLIDDYDRAAEKETVLVLIDLLKSKKIDFTYNLYAGLKQIMVIGTKKYRSLLTI